MIRKHRHAQKSPLPGKQSILANPNHPLYNSPAFTPATVAQLAEQAFRKRQVKGSNPFGGSTHYTAFLGIYPPPVGVLSLSNLLYF
jgi:hypothetical protein